MSSWKVVVPRAGFNYVLNPSAETTGNYAIAGAGVVTRTVSTTNAHYSTHGLYGYLVSGPSSGDGIVLTLAAGFDPVNIGVIGCYVNRLYTDADWAWIIGGANIAIEPTLVMQLNDDWYWYEGRHASTGVAWTNFQIWNNGIPAISFRLDSVIVTEVTLTEPDNHITYFDGDQPGCYWIGPPHAAMSATTNLVRSHGFLFDLQDDLHFDLGTMIGTGAPSHAITTESMALLPGAQITGEKLDRRSFALGGVIRGTSQLDFHEKKQNLLLGLSGQVVPEKDGQKQPVQIWHTASLPVRYIDAYYEGGLEGNFSARMDPCFWEQNVALQFAAPDPLWRSVYERSRELLPIATTTAYNLAGRFNGIQYGIAYHGYWGTAITAITPGAVSGATVIHAAVYGPDNYLYVAGDFINLNGDGDCDYIAKMSPAGVWSELSATPLNERVYALCFGPDGTLYAGGMFTNAGGDGAADFIAKIDPDAAVPAWTNVGGGPTAGATVTSVNALCIDRSGNLIIGGNFLNWSGDGDRDFAVYWDGTSYQEFSANELDAVVNAVASAPDGYVYFAGDFTSGGTGVNRVCRWKAGDTVYSPLASGIHDEGSGVRAIAVDETGRRVWFGGDFLTTEAGATVNHIVMWNGTGFEALGSGTTDIVRALAYGPDGTLWVGGDFTTITGVGACSGVVLWMGNSWAPADMQLAAVPNIYCITIGPSYAPSPRSYNVIVGFDATATIYMADVSVVTTQSTWLAYPKVIFKRVGPVTGRLGNIKVGSTGFQLYLNYTMQLGETLTIDTDPQRKTIVTSFFGRRPDAALPPSDFGAFSLLPSWRDIGNDVQWFAEVGGDTDLDCYLLWRETFESQD